jgi:hypothetical protein
MDWDFTRPEVAPHFFRATTEECLAGCDASTGWCQPNGE